MKSYEETTASVLRKIEEQRKAKGKRQRKMTAIFGGICCCLAIGSGILLWQSGGSPGLQPEGIISAEHSPSTVDPSVSADVGSPDATPSLDPSVDPSSGTDAIDIIDVSLQDLALYFATWDGSPQDTSNGDDLDWFEEFGELTRYLPNLSISFEDDHWEEVRDTLLYTPFLALNNKVSGMQVEQLRYTPPPDVLVFFYEFSHNSVERKKPNFTVLVYPNPNDFKRTAKWTPVKSGTTANNVSYQIYDLNHSDHVPAYAALITTESGCIVATIRGSFQGGVDQLARLMDTSCVTTFAEQIKY